jgi:hypothetical protein
MMRAFDPEKGPSFAPEAALNFKTVRKHSALFPDDSAVPNY